MKATSPERRYLDRNRHGAGTQRTPNWSRLLGAFMQFEEDVISRRICAGIAAAHRNGRRSGRTPRDFPHEVALDLRKGGKSWRVIGRELGVPQSTVRDALARLPKAS